MSTTLPKPVVVDFETKAIKRRPQYPPVPVGVSILKPGKKRAQYYAWAHPEDNNCTKQQAQAALREAYSSGCVLFHNGKFDADVAETHMDMKPLQWHQMHDTMFLLFLNEPQAQNLSLKPSAERLLGMPPEEKDAVIDWLKKNKPNIREYDDSGKKLLPWEAYISEAPGGLVGDYANGDVYRTVRLFNLLWPKIKKENMLAPYDRERELMPILLEMERGGIRTDFDLLDTDLKLYESALVKVDNWLRRRLDAPGLNIDGDQDFADALEAAGVVDPGSWVYTAPTKTHPGGVRSVSKANLTEEIFDDKQVWQAFTYHNKLTTCLAMFMRNWHRTASASGGIVYTTFNQVRNTDHGSVGAGTGRLSSSPNLQNIPKSFEGRGDGFDHPKFVRGLPPLPLMRKYLVGDTTAHSFGHRDYSQQELRILAHFEDGMLMQHYLNDPDFSVHKVVHKGLEKLLGREFYYSYVKNFDFQVIYGGGVPAVAAALHCDAPTARAAIAALKELLPGYDELNSAVKERARAGLPIYTWGQRRYYVQPPSFSKKHKREMTYEYKMLNYLIQGSAADCTKQALINYYNHPKRRGRLLLTVHDEIDISAPTKIMKAELEGPLREAMEAVKFDLPMLSEGKYGPRWSELIDKTK